MARRSRDDGQDALDNFERVVKPAGCRAIKTPTSTTSRPGGGKEPGQEEGRPWSRPPRVNKDLRHLRAALPQAKEWGYLPRPAEVPHGRRSRRSCPTFVTGEHFAAVYQACDEARMPGGPALPGRRTGGGPLIVMGYMTGWRISDMLALRRDDLDLEAGDRDHPGRGQQGQARRPGEAAPRRGRAPEASCRLRRRASSPGTTTGGRSYAEFAGSRRRPASTCPAGEARAHPASATSTASTTCAGRSPP